MRGKPERLHWGTDHLGGLMAKTEKARTYEGIVTISPKTVERLQTIALLVEEFNIKALKLRNQNQLAKDLADLKGKGAMQTRAYYTQRAKDSIKDEIESWLRTEWTVTHSDESTTKNMTAAEVLGLSNMDSRQIIGVQLVGACRTHAGGVDFRFDARKSEDASKVSVLVEGPDDQVNIFFDKLQEIAISSVSRSGFLGSNFMRLMRLSIAILVIGLLSLVMLTFLPATFDPPLKPNEVPISVVGAVAVFWLLPFIYWIQAPWKYFWPTWNCMIGDGESRMNLSASRRQALYQYGFGGVILATIIGILVNRLSQS